MADVQGFGSYGVIASFRGDAANVGRLPNPWPGSTVEFTQRQLSMDAMEAERVARRAALDPEVTQILIEHPDGTTTQPGQSAAAQAAWRTESAELLREDLGTDPGSARYQVSAIYRGDRMTLPPTQKRDGQTPPTFDGPGVSLVEARAMVGAAESSPWMRGIGIQVIDQDGTTGTLIPVDPEVVAALVQSIGGSDGVDDAERTRILGAIEHETTATVHREATKRPSATARKVAQRIAAPSAVRTFHSIEHFGPPSRGVDPRDQRQSQ